MANVKAQFSFSVQDGLGTKASMVIYGVIDDGDLVSALAAQWQAYATALTAVTDSKILGGNASVVLAPSASQSGKPASTNRVEQNAVINYNVPSSGRRFGIATPGWKDSLISAGAPVVGSGAGATWQAILTGAMSSDSGTNTTNDFLDLGAAVDAFISFRKHRKQLTRSSIVEE